MAFHISQDGKRQKGTFQFRQVIPAIDSLQDSRWECRCLRRLNPRILLFLSLQFDLNNNHKKKKKKRRNNGLNVLLLQEVINVLTKNPVPRAAESRPPPCAAPGSRGIDGNSSIIFSPLQLSPWKKGPALKPSLTFPIILFLVQCPSDRLKDTC